MVSSCIFAIKSIFVHFQSCIGLITSIELEDWDIRDISWTAEVQLGPGWLSLLKIILKIIKSSSGSSG